MLNKSAVKNVWDGVFSSFEEVSLETKAFDSEIWITKQQEKILQLYKQAQDVSFTGEVSQDYPLALVAALALADQELIRIVDFGGGMGVQYLELLSKIPGASSAVYYRIIEGKILIGNLPECIKRYPQLSFSSSLSFIDEAQADIVHIGSTLQYIDDWKNLLSSLSTSFLPKYFIFSDLLAGEIPTFVSRQIFYDFSIPIRMYNLSEVIKEVENLGFNLLFKSFYSPTILGQEGLPTCNLPEEYRLAHTVNLVFKHEAQ